MIPLFVMPSWMQAVSNLSPVKWGILALEGATWRGFSAAEMAVPLGVLVLVGLAGFAPGVRLFRGGEGQPPSLPGRRRGAPLPRRSRGRAR